MGILHGDCFYLGLCDPTEETERRIRETLRYIQDAESLADGWGLLRSGELAITPCVPESFA